MKQAMNITLFGWASIVTIVIGLFTFTSELSAHDYGSSDSSEGIIVTRHFTGIWDQVDQEAQGLAIQVVEQFDDSRKSVAYWYTYGADRMPTWFMGIGDLIENRIEYQLYESSDVGFMQDAMPGNDSVQGIGTMIVVFEDCDSGDVSYETDHPEVGSGSFRIERLLEVMNTHCSGGISDDMHNSGLFGEQRIELLPAREGITGNGHAGYEDYPGHMEFEIEVGGLTDGTYHALVGMQDRGSFVVLDGHGDLKFSSPAEDGRRLLNFDPRGMKIEVHDDQGAVLSSFDSMLEEDDHDHHGNGDGDGHHDGHGHDHNYDCEFGSRSGHGMGMRECVDGGEFIEIEVDLENTGVLPEAQGEAEWEMNSNRVEFSVEIENVAAGSYPLRVGGDQVGIIDAFQRNDGQVYGRIKFRDPESHGSEHLDFEPRGQTIEVLRGNETILEVDFPTE